MTTWMPTAMTTPSALHTGAVVPFEPSKLAWPRCLKATYCLRTMLAIHTEKSTLSAGRMNAVSSGSEPHNNNVGMSALDGTAAAKSRWLPALQQASNFVLWTIRPVSHANEVSAAVVCDAAAQHLTTQ